MFLWYLIDDQSPETLNILIFLSLSLYKVLYSYLVRRLYEIDPEDKY